mmetsp:Transcript_31396/g.121344  ORF Transcript_31396/g.121344 Transcript_31396/m.121344 type:complete len:121 (+) Transcript_31396:5297-5659(+)
MRQMCEIAIERLGEVSQKNLELLVTSTCIAADTGFRKGMEAGISCAEPVWNMISNAMTTCSAETCDLLLQNTAFNGLLLRVPARSSRSPKTVTDHKPMLVKTPRVRSDPDSIAAFHRFLQ